MEMLDEGQTSRDVNVTRGEVFLHCDEGWGKGEY